MQMPETYENMRLLLATIKYEEHDWLICGNLKVIAILLGMQAGYTKFPRFLCLWDSLTDDEYYVRKVWPRRGELTTGSHNVKVILLVRA